MDKITPITPSSFGTSYKGPYDRKLSFQEELNEKIKKEKEKEKKKKGSK